MKTSPARKLLIVDDDPDMRRGLRVLFDKEYAVSEAGSGNEGIELARSAAYPVVILDLVMKGMSGIETLQQLKKLNEFQKVIILTGYGCRETGISAVNMGAFKYLLKPVAFKVLKELAREGVDLYEKERNAFSDRINRPQQLESRGLSPREGRWHFGRATWNRTGKLPGALKFRAARSRNSLSERMPSWKLPAAASCRAAYANKSRRSLQE